MREPILVLGKYEILEAVGTGGMATVYRARMAGPMGFEKPVAIKILVDDVAKDDEIVRMFIDEARLGARLGHHPNIASILDFGEVGGRYFIAMEYVDGVSLAGLLKHLARQRKVRTLEVPAAVYVARSVLKALAHAHAATGADGKALGVVHRDVSPQNVLLDRSGAVKLCDFGIATGTYRGEKTRAGVVKGKAGYMSPEQAAGARLDARSDLYSLALTLVAMLTGGAVYDGKDTSDVRHRAAKGLEPARIDGLACEDGLKDVLRQALAARPADRFETAAAMDRALGEACPDPGDAGRAALEKALEKVADGAARTRAKEPKARTKAPQPTRGTRTLAPGAASGVRNALIVAAVAAALALLLALLRVTLPDAAPGVSGGTEDALQASPLDAGEPPRPDVGL